MLSLSLIDCMHSFDTALRPAVGMARSEAAPAEVVPIVRLRGLTNKNFDAEKNWQNVSTAGMGQVQPLTFDIDQVQPRTFDIDQAQPMIVEAVGTATVRVPAAISAECASDLQVYQPAHVSGGGVNARDSGAARYA